jgi:hypothetical protein
VKTDIALHHCDDVEQKDLPEFRPSIHKSQLMRSEMIHFTTTLHNYVMFEVRGDSGIPYGADTDHCFSHANQGLGNIVAKVGSQHQVCQGFGLFDQESRGICSGNQRKGSYLCASVDIKMISNSWWHVLVGIHDGDNARDFVEAETNICRNHQLLPCARQFVHASDAKAECASRTSTNCGQQHKAGTKLVVARREACHKRLLTHFLLSCDLLSCDFRERGG